MYTCVCGCVFAFVLQAAEYAEDNARCAACSAAALFPCSSSSSSTSTPGSTEQQQQQQSGDVVAAAGQTNPLFNTRALQCWILRACQQLKGGLRDKPGKSVDYYHSCYCLSGLTAAQHIPGGTVVGPPPPPSPPNGAAAAAAGSRGGSSLSRSSSRSPNELSRAHPVLNVVVDKLQQAQAYYQGLA